MSVGCVLGIIEARHHAVLHQLGQAVERNEVSNPLPHFEALKTKRGVKPQLLLYNLPVVCVWIYFCFMLDLSVLFLTHMYLHIGPRSEKRCFTAIPGIDSSILVEFKI